MYLSDARLAASQVDSGTHSEAFDSLLRQYPKDSERDLRSWEWYYLLDQSNQSLLSWQAHQANISSIDWSPDGKRIATVSFDGGAAVWDAETGDELQRFPDGNTLKYGVDWHPKSNQLAWGSSSAPAVVRIWGEESETVEILDANTSSTWSVFWNHDGSRLVVGAIPGLDKEPNQDARNLVIWKRVDGQWRIQARTTIPRNINSTGWNFDDSLVAVASDDGYVRIYNSETLTLVHQTPLFDPYDAAWHPSRNLLAFGTRSGRCVIFDAEDFTEQTSFEAHVGELCQLQWSQDGEHLASCGADGFVRIWNTTDWSLSNTFSGHSGKVSQVSWHTDSERIASAGSDGIVNIWSVSSRKSSLELDSDGDGSGDHFAWTTDQLIRTISHPSSVIDRDPRTAKIKRTISLPNADTSWRLRGRNLALREFTEGVPSKLEFVTIDVHNSVSDVSGGISVERGHIPICIHDDLKTIAFNSGDYGRTALFDLSARQEKKLGAEQFVVVKQMAWSADRNVIAIVGGGLESDDGTQKYAAWLHLVDGRPDTQACSQTCSSWLESERARRTEIASR